MILGSSLPAKRVDQRCKFRTVVDQVRPGLKLLVVEDHAPVIAQKGIAVFVWTDGAHMLDHHVKVDIHACDAPEDAVPVQGHHVRDHVNTEIPVVVGLHPERSAGGLRLIVPADMFDIRGVIQSEIGQRLFHHAACEMALPIQKALGVFGHFRRDAEVITADAVRDPRDLGHVFLRVSYEAVYKFQILQRFERRELIDGHRAEEIHRFLDAVESLVELYPLEAAGQIQDLLRAVALDHGNAPKAEPADQRDAQQNTDQIQLKEFSTD